MDTLTEKKEYDCTLATKKSLWHTLLMAGLGLGSSSQHLSEMTVRLREDEIPWSSIRFLAVLGDDSKICNTSLRLAKLDPGAYINHDGDWLLLIHPDEAALNAILYCCGTRLKELVLHNTSFPVLDVRPVSGLERLQIRRNNKLSRIEGLEQLQQLSSLSFSACHGLTQPPPLDDLKQLTSLSFSSCDNLTCLPPLDHLRELQDLNVSGCAKIEQLPSLDKLDRLTELYLGDCRSLRQLPQLTHLKQLTKLDLSHNRTTMEIPAEIRSMKNLRMLDLRGTNLRSLPNWLPEITEQFSLEKNRWDPGIHKAIVYLDGTTVDDIPDMSIFEQPYEVIAEWFRKRSQGDTRPLNEIKVVFLGDGEAGKSHTIARLMNNGGEPVDYTDQSTPGIVIKHKEYHLDGRDFTVHYWDFGGQEIMHSMHRIFLTGRTMYVVLLNARDDTQGDRARYWLHNIQSFAPNAPVLLVLNKIDQNENASVDEPDLRSRYEKLTQVVKLSAKTYTEEKFNEQFTDVLLRQIQKTGFLDAEWPDSWTQVKRELELMKPHYITGDDYQEICARCHVDDNRKNLLHWFNDLGISFCCCDSDDYALEDYVILRPDWITNALYIILFNRLVGARNGLIPHKTIYDLLKWAHRDKGIRCTLPSAKYSAGDIQYVLGVMRKFQLSLDAGDQREFIPMLCQQNSTVDVQYYRKDADTLEFTMVFDYLPNNLLHRLMVERHTELDLENAWRTGARFRHKDLGYSAVVAIDGNILRFLIRHTDPMHRPNTYLTMLKANVDRIVEQMNLKEPACHLIYKLDGKQDSFDYDMLRAMQEAGQSQAFSMTWRRMIPIADILNQSAPDGLEDEKQLLSALWESCGKLQDEPVYHLRKKSDGSGYENGQGMEDLRNRRIRDDLRCKGYRVYDQTQSGSSGSGKSIGELDLLIRKENNEPWTIVEALRIHDGSKTDWNKHLEKLIKNYNTQGLPRLYLLTYVDVSPADFPRIWSGYKSHIQNHNIGSFVYETGSCVDLTKPDSPHYIQTAKCRYNCGGVPTTVYHIFTRIPLCGE